MKSIRSCNNVEIIKAEISDAKQVLELQKIAYLSEAEIYNNYSIPPLIQKIEEIIEDFSNQVVLKAEVAYRIIGSVRAYRENDTCFIGKLIVHPDFQNQGIGSKLLNEIEQIFSNGHRFELFTGYKSEKNLYLYRKYGYKIFKTEFLTDKLTLVYLEKEREK